MQLLGLISFICLLTANLVAGDQAFNYAENECCAGELHSIKNLNDSQSFYCCGSELVTVTYGEGEEDYSEDKPCCGNKTIDEENYACANGGVAVKIPDPDKKADRTGACGPSSTDTTFLFYDPEKDMCCDNVICPKNDISECCGPKTIDTTKEVCCDGKSFEIKDGYTCCKDEYINDNEALCCTTYDFEWNEIENAVHLNGKDVSKYECCGKQAIDTTTHDCNIEHVITKEEAEKGVETLHCCGKTYRHQLYDPNWTIVAEKSGVANEDYCDNDFSIIQVEDGKGNVEACLYNSVYQLKPGEQFCFRGNKEVSIYQTSSQVCTNGKVYTLKPEDRDNGNDAYCAK